MRGVALLVCLLLVGCGTVDEGVPARRAPAAPVPVPVPKLVLDLGFAGGRALAVLADAPCEVRPVQDPIIDAPPVDPTCAVVGAALRPGGRTVASFRAGRRGIRLAVGKRRIRIPDSALDEPRAFWSPDGRRLIVESEGWRGGVVFSTATGRRLRMITSGTGYLGRQPFSPDGKRVVTGDRRGLVITAVASGKRRRVALPGGADRPAWSPAGERVAAQSGRAVTWVDLATGAIRSAPVAGAYEVAWSPDGGLIAVYHAVGQDAWAVSVIDAESGAVTEIHRFPQGAERAEFAWSPDGAQLAFQIAEPVSAG